MKEKLINKDKIGKSIKAAFPHTIPVLTGFLILGMAYGVLMQTKGYGALWSVLMSSIAFCGSMQFVAITLLTTAFDPVQAFLLSIMVNARHLFYGLTMLKKFKGAGKIRFFLIYLLCDETFSIESSIEPPEGMDKRYFYGAISFLDYSYWVVGTFCGAVIGNFIHFDTTGLDFVLTALFVVLFIEQISSKINALSGIIGLACTVVALNIFGADNLVIPSMIMIVAVLLCMRKELDRKKEV